MKFDSAIEKLRKRWEIEPFFNGCRLLSEDLVKIVAKEFPTVEVSLAFSGNLDSDGILGGWANHYVTVIKEGENSFVALDATRPCYERKELYWEFRADSEDHLMSILGEHYSGKWRIISRYCQSQSKVVWVGEKKLHQ